MLELCFDNSTQGALKCAQHCGGSAGGAFGVTVFGEERLSPWKRRKARRKTLQEIRRQAEARRREAIPLGGSPQDVLALSLGLDMGDIQSPLAAECPRKELLRRWYGEAAESLERHWRGNLTAMARLRSLQAGETVRIWADGQPDAACGLLMAAELLRNTPAEVRIVPLPFWRQRSDGTLVQYRGWGEAAPEEFGRFLCLERPLPPIGLRVLANRWRALKEENAPLRAVINGEVRSVEETFYDPLIRKHMPEGETKIGALVGDILGRERLGIGDVWLAERIRALIAAGEYELVREDPKRFCRSVIRRK